MRKLFAPRVSAEADRAWLDKHPALEEVVRKVRATRVMVREPADPIGLVQRAMALEAVGMPKNRAVWRAALEFNLTSAEDAERVARMVGFDYPALPTAMSDARRALRTLQREPYADASRRALLAATTETAALVEGGER